MIYTLDNSGETLAYRSKQELFNCLRNYHSASGMGYRPKSGDTIADLLVGDGSIRLTAADARARDCSFAANGQQVFGRWS